MKRSVLGERKHRLISVANILHSSNLGNVDISDTESWRSVVEGYFCNDSDDADGELSDLSDCDDFEFDVISEDKENQPPNPTFDTDADDGDVVTDPTKESQTVDNQVFKV